MIHFWMRSMRNGIKKPPKILEVILESANWGNNLVASLLLRLKAGEIRTIKNDNKQGVKIKRSKQSTEELNISHSYSNGLEEGIEMDQLLWKQKENILWRGRHITTWITDANSWYWRAFIVHASTTSFSANNLFPSVYLFWAGLYIHFQKRSKLSNTFLPFSPHWSLTSVCQGTFQGTVGRKMSPSGRAYNLKRKNSLQWMELSFVRLGQLQVYNLCRHMAMIKRSFSV